MFLFEKRYQCNVVNDASNLISGFTRNNAIGSVKESLVYGVENKDKGTMV